MQFPTYRYTSVLQHTQQYWSRGWQVKRSTRCAGRGPKTPTQNLPAPNTGTKHQAQTPNTRLLQHQSQQQEYHTWPQASQPALEQTCYSAPWPPAPPLPCQSRPGQAQALAGFAKRAAASAACVRSSRSSTNASAGVCGTACMLQQYTISDNVCVCSSGRLLTMRSRAGHAASVQPPPIRLFACPKSFSTRQKPGLCGRWRRPLFSRLTACMRHRPLPGHRAPIKYLARV